MTAAPMLTAGTWTLDPVASTASFTAHQLWLKIPGSIPFLTAGATIGDANDLLGATAELDLRAIETGHPRRNRDLAKPSLLDTDAHPTLTVQIGPGSATGQGWTAAATVGARGATVQVPVHIAVTERSDDGSVRVSITGVLDLAPLQPKAPRFIIGRWVQIRVDALFRA